MKLHKSLWKVFLGLWLALVLLGDAITSLMLCEVILLALLSVALRLQSRDADTSPRLRTLCKFPL